MAPAGPAAADPPAPTGGATHCQVNVICTGIGQPGSTPTAPAGGGTGGGGGGPQICSWNGLPLACNDPVRGWFSSSDGCYYRAITPPPAAGDARWKGNDPAKGALYNRTCVFSDGSQGAPEEVYLTQSPIPQPPDPKKMAYEIKAETVFDPPVLGVAPKNDPVVGGNVWLWLADPKTPRPEPLTRDGLTVALKPRLASVKWTFGDGTSVTCKGAAAAGTPYGPEYGGAPSPTCGHVFRTGSGTKRGGVFTGSVEAVWMNDVTVSDGTRVDPIEVRVNVQNVGFRVAEVQVLN
ncbi:hypothetical protein ACFVFS_38615 [Kitasatospora sp. NPDC057692]|uniref:hypothetical protein n=1 Tax=Kitasatospora sp. NPDC057692 TaxID=3346215 RepID=UPI00368E2F5D